MKCVAVVPMKLNNNRLKNKNILPFHNGKPLCSYILNTLLTIKELDEVYVYCSSERIVQYLPSGVNYLKRSKELDQDSTKMNEVLQAFATEIGADIYVMAHATAPFVKADSIRRGLKAVLDEKFDSSLAVKKVQDFLWKDGKPFNYDLESIPRTQDLEPYYMETSGFYIYKKSVILKRNRRVGDNPCLVQVGEIESIDIDEREDFDIANAVYNNILREEEK